MGLFIGASILTLLEILDYIYEAWDGGLVGSRRGWGESRGLAGFLVHLDWQEVKLRALY